MPLYEYKCKNCGNTFEQLVFFSEKDARFDCPTCNSEETSRLMSSFSSGSSNGAGGLTGLSSCSSPSGGFS
ncbi:MAG: zinc ribbon domain-containing protein [Thermodesulfobacteriota bacterium]|nr:zinc ribbon domain-containing protein [Thermodesulfobacteriota bacterium]